MIYAARLLVKRQGHVKVRLELKFRLRAEVD
jgi:hypothetical protein